MMQHCQLSVLTYPFSKKISNKEFWPSLGSNSGFIPNKLDEKFWRENEKESVFGWAGRKENKCWGLGGFSLGPPKWGEN